LPKPQVYNTFDKYYEFLQNRRDGKIDWINYTPYENRLIGSFIILDQPERAHALIEFFLQDQRPQGWNDWAEVVWKNYRIPRTIGDMPHTWVGSDFINAIRAMFVYENEYDQSLFWHRPCTRIGLIHRRGCRLKICPLITEKSPIP
jgi:hypothetical protein